MEALAALVLVAAAAVMVTAAAIASLRSVRQAEVLARVGTIASRELASLQSRGAPEGTDHSYPVDPGLAGTVATHTVTWDGNVARLSVTVVAGRPSQRLTLTTRQVATP